MSSRTEWGPQTLRPAFTLIELIVVIAIIATLASIVAPSIFSNVGDAHTQAARSQLQIFEIALDSYRLDNDSYPSSSQGLASLRDAPVGELARSWRGPYLRQNVPLDPWGRPYIYIYPGVTNPSGYDLYSLGKDGRPGGTEWPGNVRELKQVVEWSVAFSNGHLAFETVRAALSQRRSGRSEVPCYDVRERERLGVVLKECGGDIDVAAVRLGIHRATVYRHLKRLGINRPRQGISQASSQQ